MGIIHNIRNKSAIVLQLIFSLLNNNNNNPITINNSSVASLDSTTNEELFTSRKNRKYTNFPIYLKIVKDYSG